MSIFIPNRKPIVAAVLLTAMFSLPLGAQTADVDDLFTELQNAEAAQSDRISKKILTIWSKSGSASMDLLLARGREALQDGNTQTAIEHFTALIDHAPDFPPAYTDRAEAYYEAGYIGPAMADLRMALALNPRDFEAMTGLAYILETSGNPEQAVLIYQKVQNLLPHDKDIQEAVSRLHGDAL